MSKHKASVRMMFVDELENANVSAIGKNIGSWICFRKSTKNMEEVLKKQRVNVRLKQKKNILKIKTITAYW